MLSLGHVYFKGSVLLKIFDSYFDANPRVCWMVKDLSTFHDSHISMDWIGVSSVL